MREIIRSGLKVGVATFASLLGWVVAAKILALTLGAPGVGLFGILRQLLQNLTLFASFCGQGALVQGIASRPLAEDKLRFTGSVLQIQLAISLIVVILLQVGAPWLGPMLIPHPQAISLIRILSIAMIVVVGQNYYVGILNGHRLINELVKSQVLGPLTTFALVLPMIWLLRRGQPYGYVIMLGAPALVVTVAAAKAGYRAGWIPDAPWRIDRSDWSSFFRMSAVLLLVGLLGTGSQFFISWLIARRLGLAEAGQFWAAWTLSMAYVTILLGSFGTYYMPSLSSLTEREAQRNLIRSYLEISLLAMPILVSFVVVFKIWAIRILFSKELLPAVRVMRWMLIGDFIKGISWVLGLPMMALGHMKWYFWSETLLNIWLACSAYVWICLGGGIEGLGVLFFVMYLIHLPIVSFYAWKKLGFVWKQEQIYRLLGGLVMVITLSVHSWRDTNVHFEMVLGYFLLTGLFICFNLHKQLKSWLLRVRTLI